MKEYKSEWYRDLDNVGGSRNKNEDKFDEYLNQKSKEGWDLVNVTVYRQHWNDATLLVFCRELT